MKIISYGLLFIIGIGILIYVIGYFLPETPKLTKETVYSANAEKVYNVITDNQNWQYRTSLDNLEILSRDGENEVWQETTNGITILLKRERNALLNTMLLICRVNFYGRMARHINANRRRTNPF